MSGRGEGGDEERGSGGRGGRKEEAGKKDEEGGESTFHPSATVSKRHSNDVGEGETRSEGGSVCTSAANLRRQASGSRRSSRTGRT